MGSPADEAALARLQVSADGSTWVEVSAPIASVDVEDHDTLTDKVVVVFDDNTGLLADASFAGLRVRVGLGWQADQAMIFEGVVTGARVLAQPGGQRIELTALDFTYWMTLRPYDPATWQPGEKLSAVLTRIVTRPEYSIRASKILPAADVSMAEKRPVGQAGLNEWQFLLKQAAEQGCLAFLEFDGRETSTFYFVPKTAVAAAAPIGALRYCRGTGELVEFHYERVGSAALPVVEAASIDPGTGQQVTAPAAPPPPRPPLPPPGTERRRDVDADLRAAVQALTELAAAADSKISPPQRRATGQAATDQAGLAARVEPDPTRRLGLSGRGVTVGNVALRAKSMVTIQGVAPWAEGDWYVTKVNHRYTRERAGTGTRSSFFSVFEATR